MALLKSVCMVSKVLGKLMMLKSWVLKTGAVDERLKKKVGEGEK